MNQPQGETTHAALNRRRLLAGSLAAPQIKAQSKPEKLVYVGENGPWHWTMVEESAPEFQKQTGICVDFTLLPVDPWRARLRAELGAATYDGKLAGVPGRITTGIMHYRKPLMQNRGFEQPPGTWPEFLKAALAPNTPPSRYGFGIFGRQGAAIFVGLVPWLYPKRWQKQAMIRGNALPRNSILTDPETVAKIGWPPVAVRRSRPASPRWPIRCGTPVRSSCARGCRRRCLGPTSAKEVLDADAVAADQRRSLRRAGIKAG